MCAFSWTSLISLSVPASGDLCLCHEWTITWHLASGHRKERTCNMLDRWWRSDTSSRPFSLSPLSSSQHFVCPWCRAMKVYTGQWNRHSNQVNTSLLQQSYVRVSPPGSPVHHASMNVSHSTDITLYHVHPRNMLSLCVCLVVSCLSFVKAIHTILATACIIHGLRRKRDQSRDTHTHRGVSRLHRLHRLLLPLLLLLLSVLTSLLLWQSLRGTFYLVSSRIVSRWLMPCQSLSLFKWSLLTSCFVLFFLPRHLFSPQDRFDEGNDGR